MTWTRVVRRSGVILGPLLFVAFAGFLDVDAHDRGRRLHGTWVVNVPGGRTGFNTYHADGTMTGVTSTIFGGPPWPSGAPVLAGADHGVWRRVGKGYEAVALRVVFDPATGDPTRIARIRTFFSMDPGGRSTTGTFLVDQWICPDALSCPDPNTTPPDVKNISPPPPFNTVTQTRVPRPTR